MKKKILVGIMMMIICLSFSVTAFALTDGEWKFQLLDDEITITGYLGEGGDISVPETIYGCPVTKVEALIFDDIQNDIKTITYPSTVKKIERLGYDISDRTGPKVVILPEGVTQIAGGAFSRCVNLKSVQLPSTLERIGNDAFSGCKSLKQIKLPSNLIAIGNSCFSESGITSIDLSYINATLGDWLFAGCVNLTDVKLNTSMAETTKYMFASCESLKHIDLPSNIAIIKEGSFCDCVALESIILPTSLKEIRINSFCGCASLTEVVIPYGTTTIKNGGSFFKDAFESCANLQAIYIPDTVTEIGPNFIDENDNCIVYCSSGSRASEVCKKYEISYLTDSSVNSLITVYYNGTRVSFHEHGQNPELINSRTLVPLRAIFEAMDADVEWNQETKTVTATRDGVEISISIGANVMYKDGEEVAVDVPAQLINDRTMVPVRVIAEAFGADVEWNNNGRAVIINE